MSKLKTRIILGPGEEDYISMIFFSVENLKMFQIRNKIFQKQHGEPSFISSDFQISVFFYNLNHHHRVEFTSRVSVANTLLQFIFSSFSPFV